MTPARKTTASGHPPPDRSVADAGPHPTIPASATLAEIDPASLTAPQYAGRACVVCGRPFDATEYPVRVGLLGTDLHPVGACRHPCVRRVTELVMEREYHPVLPPLPAGRPVDPPRPGRSAISSSAGLAWRPESGPSGQLPPSQEINP